LEARLLFFRGNQCREVNALNVRIIDKVITFGAEDAARLDVDTYATRRVSIVVTRKKMQRDLAT
jgi:hypothetical protein